MDRTDWFPFDNREDYREALLNTGAFIDDECELSEDDKHALECEHRSIVVTEGNCRSCEDCSTVWR